MAPTGFDWDEGNREKNWTKHRVTVEECEQVFANVPILIVDEPRHSVKEKRYAAFGQTDGGRRLFVIFTWRGERIRIISARDQDKKEKRQYEQTEKTKEA